MTDGGILPRRVRPPRFADTKFIAPPVLAGIARRPVLHDRLSAADHLPVTIVVGVGGSGKTALLSEWFHSRDPATGVWISADRGDADPVRFWRAVIAAVQHLDPTFGVDASDIITLDGEVSADALESLVVDESLLDRRLSIVIDDAHLIATDALEQIGHLVARRPQNLRFVLGSRTDPQIGLARLRLHGLVAEIRDADLRFGVSEIRSMLERIGLDVGNIDIDDLHDRTEGWAAGVQLAALSVVGAPDPGQRLKALTGTHSIIAAYLLDEVLANQPPHVHRFLENTCVLDELDAASCEVLLADDDGNSSPAILLHEVESANLFLTRVDPAGTLFRYHHLFAELLRDQLRTRDPERYRRQHRRAAEVFQAAGDPIRAVHHMWKAGEREHAALLIARNPLSVYLTPADAPPLDLLDYITDEDLLGDSNLVGGYALALLMNARAREASDLIARVDRIVGLDKLAASERINLLSLQAGARLVLGDTASAARNMRQVVDAIEAGETTSEQWIAVAIPVGMRSAAWEGDLELARRIAEFFRPGSDPHLDQVDFTAAVGLVEHMHGDLAAAIRSVESSIEAAERLGVSGSGSEIAARAVLAASLVDMGALDEAEPHIAAVLDSARVERVPSIVLATLARTRVLRARGDFDGALGALAVARSRFGDTPSTLSNYLDLAEFMVAGALRDMDRAEELTTRVLDPLLAGRMASWCELVRGRIAIAAAKAEPLVELARTPRERFELGVLLTRIAFEGQSDDFERRAAELVELADETGLLLHLAEGGTGVLQEVRRQARMRTRSRITERLSLLQPLPRPAHRLAPHHPHDELSAREQIVLRYMATSMSNQEIAAALYLSVNTVKTHIKNVLRKMHAGSRQQAVERARELNYL